MSEKRIVKDLVQLNLVGLDGNAFYLLAAFKNAARKQNCLKEDVEKVVKLATGGDYDHLLSVLLANTTS